MLFDHQPRLDGFCPSQWIGADCLHCDTLCAILLVGNHSFPAQILPCISVHCWNFVYGSGVVIHLRCCWAVQEDDEAEDLDAADQDADVSDESLDREEL
jgi:hypothetical protein